MVKTSVHVVNTPRAETSVQEVEVDVGDVGLYEDVGFMTAMLMVTMTNYASTGHMGGPLSYTPANVVVHLGGAENGGLAWDFAHPKHPFADKFMMAGGHCIPTCYALWTILYEALTREAEASGRAELRVDPRLAFLSVDMLGFRRSPDAVAKLLKEHDLEEHPLFAQAKLRGIRALMGHAETTDATNDVNGGPSGIGAANAAGKAMFWDFVGAPSDTTKVLCFEGEFAFTEGHAQELKTMALAQQVGKRLRLFFSYNNAGIDDELVGTSGVINEKYRSIYDIEQQFTSYGWNVFRLADGSNYADLLAVHKAMEEWPADDRRPMVVVATTVKGWWPAAKDGQVGGTDQIVSAKAHPYGFALNAPYYVALASTYEERYGMSFAGIRDGAPATTRERLIQFKENVDRVLAVMDKDDGRIRKWIVSRLVAASAGLRRDMPVRFDTTVNPFLDERLLPAHLPLDPVEVSMTHPTSGASITSTIRLFLDAGKKMGARRAVGETLRYINYVTNNRYLTVAADLSSSINVEAANLLGHYDPTTNPVGTRLKAGIQECVNASTVCALASQTLSEDPSVHAGVWGVSGTYGAFTPLMYLPVRIFSQQNQDSPFALGTVTVIAGHTGVSVGPDARSHMAVYSPQVWRMGAPEGHFCNVFANDYNDVAPAYLAAASLSARKKELGVIILHIGRPDAPVWDRTLLADSDIRAASRGCYVMYEPKGTCQGTVLVQGDCPAQSVYTLITEGRLEAAGLAVRIVAVVSEELFLEQSQSYRDGVLSKAHRMDCMYLTTGPTRMAPLRPLGPLTEAYSVGADHDGRWRTGGLEKDMVEEAHLDVGHVFDAIKRFVDARPERIRETRAWVDALLQ